MKNHLTTTLVRLLSVFILTLAAGCARLSYTKVEAEPAAPATSEIPENQLLDVGIEFFDAAPVTENDAKQDRNHAELRSAEARYVPYHLRQTLQGTAQWGAVRVTPSESDAVDVLLKGQIVESNGEQLVLRIDAKDATGRAWFNKTYLAEADADSYQEERKDDDDPYQAIYNAIANDLVEYRERLDQVALREIRRVSELRFSARLAPNPFNRYLRPQPDGIYKVARLPADDDPMVTRVRKLREREYMLVDTLNDHYGSFYRDMREPYENWRRFNQTEVAALRDVNRKSLGRKLLGAGAIAGAIAYELFSKGRTSGSLTSVMVIGGASAFKSGVDIAAQAEIHEEAIEELGESFNAEIKPMVIDLEGRTVELSGSAEEQYRKWRNLLQEIYASETGFATSPGQEPPGAKPESQ